MSRTMHAHDKQARITPPETDQEALLDIARMLLASVDAAGGCPLCWSNYYNEPGHGPFCPVPDARRIVNDHAR